MATYNESNQEIRRSIKSALLQTYKDFELIIVDDNPKSIRISKILRSFSYKDKRIKLIFNKKNEGRVFSRNEALKLSKGRLISILDADDVWTHDKLKDQIYFMIYNNLDFVFSNASFINDNNVKKGPMYKFESIIKNDKLKYYLLHYNNIAPHSTWIVKRQVYNKLGNYRDIIVEDFDFLLRALSHNFKLGYDSEVLVYIGIRQNDVVSNNALKIYLTEKALRKFIEHNGYDKAMSLNILKNNIYVSKTELSGFKSFLILKRKIKYHMSIKELIVLMYLMMKYKYVFIFIFHIYIQKIKDFIFNCL